MKIYNKFVESKKEPSNKNDIWFDGEVFNIYKEGKWQAFTFRISDAEAVIRIVREFVDYYNNDIKPTVQEAQEAAARIETYVNLAIEAAETSTRNNELFVKLNAQLAELFSELQSLIDASNTAISSAQEAASLASSQAKLTQQATQETIEATENANNAINTINILVETLEETINNKVDKIPGKGLSTNDFTNEDKGKLDELSNKVNDLLQGDQFDKEGNYPSLHVGTADDLAGRGESVPASFGFRASGGKSIKDGRAYIKRIKGNSVVWNQLYPTDWRHEEKGVLSISQGGVIQSQGTTTGSYWNIKPMPSNIEGHKYLFEVSGLSSTFKGRFALHNRSTNAEVSNGYAWFIYTNNDTSLGKNLGFDRMTKGDVIDETYEVRVIDLTKAFPNDWQNINTIEDFNARVATLGVDMNAYNEGQVIHCNTESIKSVGDNAWDEEWELGRINSAGQEMTSNSHIRSKNYNRCIPGETMYITCPKIMLIDFYDVNKEFVSYLGKLNETFAVPANACYFKISTSSAGDMTAYNNDIMITLVHSGWKQDTDAGYQPYWQDTLPLPIIRKYFPNGMKSAGSTHDEIRFNKASGKWEKVQRIGSVDMGDMAWGYNSDNNVFSSYTLMDLMTHPAELSERAKGLLCSKYSPSRTYIAKTMDDKSWLRIPESVTIKDTTYTDAATFKASLQGVILYYELAEPIVTELDAEDQNFRDYYNVADFGTEEAQSSVPSAPFSADIIYQFNAVDMIREHELEITELQSIIATMQAQLASLINN